MPLLKEDTSVDGFEIRFYDYGVEEMKRRFFLWVISSRVSEQWNIYVPDSPDYKAIGYEIVEGLKFQGVRKTLKNVGKRTSITSLNINGRLFEAKRASVDFAKK
jgi:hypothetical protein